MWSFNCTVSKKELTLLKTMEVGKHLIVYILYVLNNNNIYILSCFCIEEL